MQGHWDGTMVHIATCSLYTMANTILYSQFQKKLKYCENQHHLYICQIVDILNIIKYKFPLIFAHNNLK